MRLLSLSFSMLAFAQAPVVMNRYDAATTGANTHEHVLNTKDVNPAQFGKLYSYYVDGAVYAQPLYLPGISIAGGVHSVLYVATMNDKAYAFDANKPGPPLWIRDFTNEMAGITPVPITDITGRNDLNLVGNAGIEGTPVIDLAGGALYLVVRAKENGTYVQRLDKLDIANGKDKTTAATIQAEVKSRRQSCLLLSDRSRPSPRSANLDFAHSRGPYALGSHRRRQHRLRHGGYYSF